MAAVGHGEDAGKCKQRPSQLARHDRRAISPTRWPAISLRRAAGRPGRGGRAGGRVGGDGRRVDDGPGALCGTSREMTALRERAELLKGQLLALAEADTEAYLRVTAAYRLPKGTETEQAARAAAVEAAMREATRVPLARRRGVRRGPGRWRPSAATHGNRNASGDAAVGALLAHAGPSGGCPQRAHQSRRPARRQLPLHGRRHASLSCRPPALLRWRARWTLRTRGGVADVHACRSPGDDSRAGPCPVGPGRLLLLTLGITYPLVRQFTAAIPGDSFDGWQNYWNLWWVKPHFWRSTRTPGSATCSTIPPGSGCFSIR